jgi:hypothetical protein
MMLPVHVEDERNTTMTRTTMPREARLQQFATSRHCLVIVLPSTINCQLCGAGSARGVQRWSNMQLTDNLHMKHTLDTASFAPVCCDSRIPSKISSYCTGKQSAHSSLSTACASPSLLPCPAPSNCLNLFPFLTLDPPPHQVWKHHVGW